jgi:hypothetical protein
LKFEQHRNFRLATAYGREQTDADGMNLAAVPVSSNRFVRITTVKDIANITKTVPAIPAVTSGTNEELASVAVDRAGYQSCMFVASIGDKTDGTVAFEMQEGDTDEPTTPVADADLSVTEASIAIGDAAAGANTVKKIGYKGNKRYVRLVATVASNAGSCPVSAVAVLGHPQRSEGWNN